MMETQIKELRVLLPAIVAFNEEGHSGAFTLVYIDQLKGDVILPGDFTRHHNVYHPEAFEEAIRKYMAKSVKPIDTPSVPRDGFEKLDPESYMGDD